MPLSACVSTPAPNPVASIQSGDENLTCENIDVEFRGNTDIATAKIAQNNKDDGLDVLKGFFVWPGLADFNNAPGHEGNALIDRNIRLRHLAALQNCDVSDWPAQPARYD